MALLSPSNWAAFNFIGTIFQFYNGQKYHLFNPNLHLPRLLSFAQKTGKRHGLPKEDSALNPARATKIPGTPIKEN
jgi:hypothetical protein